MEGRFEPSNAKSKVVPKEFSIHNVTGCGRDHSFRLVVDTHQTMSLLPKERLTRGFKVFVTIPGKEKRMIKGSFQLSIGEGDKCLGGGELQTP